MPRQTSTRSTAPAKTGAKAAAPSAPKSAARSTPSTSTGRSQSKSSTKPSAPKTETSLNQARPSNRKAGIHQRAAAKRETTRESRSAQSKLTSTGSPSARAAASASKGEEDTRDQLYQRAAVLGINGRSRMTKAELTAAIKDHGG